MKTIYYLTICLVIIFQSCSGQSKTKKEFYNKDFNWKITIPESFDTVSTEQWEKMQNKGAEAIEKTYDEKIDNRAKTIFVFQSGQLNYLESNYQPFDIATDGDYLEACKGVNEVVYQTFVTQMQGIKIDTATSTEKIDNLEFQKFKMKVTYPNKMVLNVLMYNRLFGKKEFTLNIMYVDEAKGDLMMKAWKKSTFGLK